MRDTGKSKRLALAGAFRRRRRGGLTRDKTRPSRIAKLVPSFTERASRLRSRSLRTKRRIGTARRMAEAVGLRVPRAPAASSAAVQAVQGPIVDKLRDTVGLCVDSPTHAVAFPSTRRARSGARSNPARPAVQKGTRRTMTHDYKRNGTTTLFAANKGTRRNLDGSQHTALSPLGLHPLPQRTPLARSPGRQNDPRHPRQLRLDKHPTCDNG